MVILHDWSCSWCCGLLVHYLLRSLQLVPLERGEDAVPRAKTDRGRRLQRLCSLESTFPLCMYLYGEVAPYACISCIWCLEDSSDEALTFVIAMAIGCRINCQKSREYL